MTLEIPFVYKATVIKPKCRNTTDILIEDKITIDIAEYDNLPVAFKVGNLEYYWDNKSLWMIASEYDRVSEKNITVTIEEIKENTENPHEDLRVPYAQAPFFNYSKYGTYRNYSYRDIELVYSSKDEAVNQNREYIKDDREEIVSSIKEVADSMIFIKGLMYDKINEPRYKISTYGLGENHGGTSLGIENGFNANSCPTAYYSALEYDLAVEEAINVATNRRDTNYIDSLKKTSKIEVLIPEALQLDMTKEIKNISLADLTPNDLLEMSKEDFKNLINKKYFEEHSRKIEVLDYKAKFANNGIEVLILDSKRAA
ncbi:hypothetical protein [Aliarcobacter butzleri]|uniref:hypothetical protein n=1 Tax=Aliarcobacter butzleri TaxID=28197 RepID=UPI00126A75CF|nr:hypothetical protein [Aliarcobacter butzleri]